MMADDDVNQEMLAVARRTMGPMQPEDTSLWGRVVRGATFGLAGTKKPAETWGETGVEMLASLPTIMAVSAVASPAAAAALRAVGVGAKALPIASRIASAVATGGVVGGAEAIGKGEGAGETATEAAKTAATFGGLEGAGVVGSRIIRGLRGLPPVGGVSRAAGAATGAPGAAAETARKMLGEGRVIAPPAPSPQLSLPEVTATARVGMEGPEAWATDPMMKRLIEALGESSGPPRAALPGRTLVESRAGGRFEILRDPRTRGFTVYDVEQGVEAPAKSFIAARALTNKWAKGPSRGEGAVFGVRPGEGIPWPGDRTGVMSEESRATLLRRRGGAVPAKAGAEEALRRPLRPPSVLDNVTHFEPKVDPTTNEKYLVPRSLEVERLVGLAATAPREVPPIVKDRVEIAIEGGGLRDVVAENEMLKTSSLLKMSDDQLERVIDSGYNVGTLARIVLRNDRQLLERLAPFIPHFDRVLSAMRKSRGAPIAERLRLLMSILREGQ